MIAPNCSHFPKCSGLTCFDCEAEITPEMLTAEELELPDIDPDSLPTLDFPINPDAIANLAAMIDAEKHEP